MKLYKAADAWKMLNGVFCIYKRPAESLEFTKRQLRLFLCEELNKLNVRQPGTMTQDVVVLNENGELEIVDRLKKIDYSDHPLVVGDRYQPPDIEIESLDRVDGFSSGVCVMAVNEGCDRLPSIRKHRKINVYEICGRLGHQTVDYTNKSKIIEKSTYHHVTEHKFSKMLSRLQANFQSAAFHYAGVDIQSQQAYEMASKGMVRPKEVASALFYGLKLIDFKAPQFTLQAQIINETDWYMKNFIHELGIALKTSACCTKIRKIRHGHFTLDHALLWKHWTLENIINNISLCEPLLSKPKLRGPDTLEDFQPENPLLLAEQTGAAMIGDGDSEGHLESVRTWKFDRETQFGETEDEVPQLLGLTPEKLQKTLIGAKSVKLITSE